MDTKTSALCAASMARSHWSFGSISPNQTIAGRSVPPQRQRGGKCSNGTCSFRPSRPHEVHRKSQMSPCNFTTSWLPALSCRPSMFCVTRVNLNGSLRCNSAKARCPGLGCAPWIRPRSQSYHSQTRRESLEKASAVQSVSGEWFLQSPSVPRKVGTWLSAEIPAPVKATILPVRRLRRTASVALSTFLQILDKKFCRKFDTMLHRKRLSMR